MRTRFSARLVASSLAFLLAPGDARSIDMQEALRGPASLSAGDVLDATHLLSIRQGSAISRQVSSLRGQNLETATGDRIQFNKWYSTKWSDMRVLWLTQITRQSGLVWGVSTGERGEKYLIQPALTLGLIHQMQLSRHQQLTFYGTTVIGGKLQEKTCTADYGEIGGIQEVNCRLAGGILPPSETLQYLMNERPKEDMLMLLRYTCHF